MLQKKVKFDRLFLMKIHGYISSFFLPIACLYVLTGTLYLFDVHGEKITTDYLPDSLMIFPQGQAEAESIIASFLETEKLPSLPDDYSYREGQHRWIGLRDAYILSHKGRKGRRGEVVLTHHEHGFWHQMVLIHKGHGGPIYTVFGILLGINLFLSLLTGAVIVLKTKLMRDVAYKIMLIGLVT
ncbi:MAG: hypothetical protein JKY45_11215 [Emcibacter sp.]|nr:hypothetical protein [Emcibacter sp.]